MPPLALLVPIALPAFAALVAAVLGALGWNAGRAIAAAGAWLAALAILAIWIPVRSTQELSLGPLGFGSNFDLRIDAVAVAFGLIVLVPAAILLTLQSRSWQESTVAALGVAAAVMAIESGSVLLTALAGCTAATLAVILLDIEDLRAPRPSWGMLLAAWLALAWAGAVLQVLGGTAVYAAVPVAALTAPVFLLLAFSAIFASGLFPWSGWTAKVWARPSLRGAGIVVATLQPLGLYLLVRAYEMGNGHYPLVAFNVLLASWGALVAFGAAARAQAAQTRRQYMAEVLPGLAGFALMSIAVGSALGMVAAIVLLASSAILVASLPLLPGRSGAAPFLVIAAAAGVPPGLAFGGRVLGLDAAFEAGDALGIVGIAGAATWLLAAAAAARAVGLPAGPERPAGETFPRTAMALGALSLAAGPALGLGSVLVTTAVADVMTVPPEMAGAGPTSVITISTVFPAAALLGPMLLLGIAALAIARPATALGKGEAKAPLFRLRAAAAAESLLAWVREAAIPEQYSSLFNPRALDAAAAGGTPLLWLAGLVALAFAVTR